MVPLVDVIRAVAVEFLRRALSPVMITAVVSAIMLHALGIWLVSTNAWWWLFESLLILVTVAAVALLLVIRLTLRIAEPVQSAAQRRAVKSFTDKMQRTAENVQTPYFVIVYRVLRDLIRRRQGPDSFIAGFVQDSKSLAPDFLELRRTFDEGR